MEIVGNFKAKRTVGDWLTEKFKGTFSVKCPNCGIPVIGNDKFVTCPHCDNGFEHHSKTHLIIWGDSGNGKTFLCEYFAEFFDVELYRVTAEDITNQDELNYFIQSVNSTALDGREKLIVVEDYNEFGGLFGNRAIRTIKDFVPKSRYPFIFTHHQYPKRDDFVNAGILVYMMKPFKNQMFSYLKSINTGLSDEKLMEIAVKSASFRSAVLTAKSSVNNDFLLPYVSKRTLLKNITKRELQEPVTAKNIKMIFNSIRGIDDNAFAVMKRFSDFDFQIKRCYRDVDPFLINNMVEPVEKVTFEATYKKPSFKKIKPPKKKKAVEKKKEKKKTSNATLDSWF